MADYSLCGFGLFAYNYRRDDAQQHVTLDNVASIRVHTGRGNQHFKGIIKSAKIA